MPDTQLAFVHPKLSQLLGGRYTESPFERSFYRRDLAVVPPVLASLIGKTLPDAVARPQSADEVSAILRYAGERGLPVTPRAAATTAYWNAVPMRRGLVLDLNGMRGLLALNEAQATATVLPGTRWQELDRLLRRSGFTLLSYPTSAPAATVGGWISMEGHGIGSLKHGEVADQVTRLEVVLPDGSIIHVPGTSQVPGTLRAADFAGSEGTLGIITRVELAVRPQPPAIGHHLLAFPDMAALQEVVGALASATPRPFYAHFAAPSYGDFLRRAGFAPAATGPILALTYDGDTDEVAAGAQHVQREAGRSGATELASEIAALEWEERFSALRLKRAGPSVLGAESWLPLDRLAGYESDVAALSRRQGLLIATYGTAVAPGLATVMSLYGCDESRTLPYILALSLTKKLYDVAFRHGGRPYGTGVWNTPYLARALPPGELAERRNSKRTLDRANTLNPGKLYAPPPLLWPPTFKMGMELLSGVRRVTKGWL